jgi:D-alanyl-D-alanine carboxypeptidase (penicillin-binding protein 5/6)
MRKTLALFFCLLFMLENVYADEPQVAAQAAVLMDLDSGRVLWGKNENEPMSMASTTKIMTAIIALERGNPNDIVTVSKQATLAPPVKMHLSEGEQIRLYDLLLAMMLQSYNDSAVAVAEHICGSTEEFCEAMNLKAGEIGCKDTFFETPNGLDKGNHHSTAADMALITRYALENDDFVKLIATPSASFTTNKSSYSFTNKDRLLREYEGALGVKTGFTNKAGQCFAGAAKRGDEGYVSVVLASGWGSAGKEQKWIDTKRILDYGFESYGVKEIISEGQAAGSLAVERGESESVALACRDFVRLNVGNDEEITYKAEIPQSIEAPVAKGQRVGTMKAYIGEECVAQSAVVCTENVDKSGFWAYIGDILDIFASICGGSVI